MAKMRTERYSISAIDGTGRECTLLVHDIYDTHSSSDGDMESPAAGRITTENGELLEYHGKGRYRSVSGVLFTSDDPKAP